MDFFGIDFAVLCHLATFSLLPSFSLSLWMLNVIIVPQTSDFIWIVTYQLALTLHSLVLDLFTLSPCHLATCPSCHLVTVPLFTSGLSMLNVIIVPEASVLL